jgi:hypothetical protein
MIQLSSFKKNADSLAAAVAGACIIFLFTSHGGIGISPDGVVYSSVAENIKLHGTLNDFNQESVVDYPVGYPIFLGCISFLAGTKPLFFAPALNAILFAFLIYLCGRVMDGFQTPSKWYKRMVLACIVCSPCLLEIYSMLWSETIFIVWLLLFIIALHRYFQTPAIKALLAAAIIAAMAAVTRYAGVTLIGTGGLLLLLDTQLQLRKKLLHLLLYSITSPVFFIINLARNYSVSETLMGVREKAIRSLGENMHDTGAVFLNWLPFFRDAYLWAVGLTCLIIIFFILLWLWQRFGSRQKLSYENIASSFFLVYLLFMIISASKSRFEQLNSRLLSPLFIPLLWGGSSWLVTVTKKATATKKKWLAALGAVIFISLLYTQLAADYRTWDDVKDAGIPGYTEDEWKSSETVQYMQKNPLLFKKGSVIYSNADDAVYFFTGQPSQLLPHKEFPQDVKSFLSNRHCYVVWFNNGENNDLIDMNFITTVKKMSLLKQFSDGAIYAVDE